MVYAYLKKTFEEEKKIIKKHLSTFTSILLTRHHLYNLSKSCSDRRTSASDVIVRAIFKSSANK